MKAFNLRSWSSGLGVVMCMVLGGCASADAPKREPLVVGAVGPRVYGLVPQDREGTLAVYTELDAGPTASGDEPPHRNYTILRADGSILRRVDNSRWREPFGVTPVELPEGNYVVEAFVSNFGFVRVPVVVHAYRTTTVDLSGQLRSEFKGVPAQAVVTLPDGRVVGYRPEVALGK